MVARMAAEQQVSIPRLLIESVLASEAPTRRKQAIEELFALNRLLAAVSNNVNNRPWRGGAGRPNA